jgi:hypothetical protein
VAAHNTAYIAHVPRNFNINASAQQNTIDINAARDLIPTRVHPNAAARLRPKKIRNVIKARQKNRGNISTTPSAKRQVATRNGLELSDPFYDCTP